MTPEQLFPERRALEVAEVYANLRLAELAPPDRPYVIANMVATVDGRATLEGRTAGISSEADKELFLDLRTQVDAVMVGTGTIAVEGYGPLVRSPERRARREELGLEPVPLAVTVTGSMELPVDAPLFQDPDSRIVVATNSDRPPASCPADVSVERIPGPELDLAAFLGLLRTQHGVRSTMLEGGPTLLAAMVEAELVDELFLTVAAKLAGTSGPTILERTPLPHPIELTLESVVADGGNLFLRYALATQPPPTPPSAAKAAR